MTNNDQHTISSSSNEIDAFWQTGIFSSFIGVDNVTINYAQFATDINAECIVISPGRVESYIKYQELAFELHQHGYNTFIIDHRGQGLSQRMSANKHKGHVVTFDDYSHDLATFINQYVNKSCAQNIKPILLAHSMGGAIATRVLQLYPDLVKAAVLSSPMFAINNGGIPLWLAKALIHSGALLNKVISNEPWYFFGQGNYNPKSFADNRITHSKSRYQRFVNRYQLQPKAQLGGVTFQWLAQALKVNADIFNDISKINTPILILQAGEDTIVDNAAQDSFCELLHQQNESLCQTGKPIRIDGAYHELFFEQDKYRQQAINTTLKWLADLQ
ncbi:alpha/beta fold hydrolase [Thalassotalea profundi]|uniref:Lysophospholipase L2 n=1 Tax=Thalassotalea profundi TaxID=2036687 RepID=A0ABQ3INJ6_9GAMM|nr:alpha/beta fold hydrolase [Thalassotalea profundi]GHE89657.1 lysophospholipase L2 [Thalassotalea profundi]